MTGVGVGAGTYVEFNFEFMSCQTQRTNGIVKTPNHANNVLVTLYRLGYINVSKRFF